MNKQKVIKNYTSRESPYKLFSTEGSLKNDSTLFSKSITSHHRFYIKNNYKINNPNNNTLTERPLSSKTKDEQEVSSIAKKLKSMTLSNELYSNYMDYYSNLTQDYCFKTPKIANYPLRKNQKYLPIKSQQNFASQIVNSEGTKDSIFLDFLKDADQNNKQKIIEKKPYGFKYGETKIRIDRQRPNSSYHNTLDGKEFQNLCESNIFESDLLNQIGIKNIDMYNSLEEQDKNFKFFNSYLEKLNNIDDILNNNNDNFFKNIEFQARTAIIKKNVNFKLDIYSLCFKFYLLGNKAKPQKLFFPFKLLPLFYLLDFKSFKIFISEIIYYDSNKNCISFIDNDLLLSKIKKYYNFSINNIQNNSAYINNITYFKNELSYFFLIYDWIICNKENKNDYKCYKLKITLPKIKFIIDNKDIIIFKHLNKHIVANLIINEFNNWEKFILFDLFSNRKFKYLTNSIMVNKRKLIKTKKILLNKDPNKLSINNKQFEFYISEIGENHSNYYWFIPYIILVLIGEHRKKYQKIYLSLKDSKNLLKFKQYWGTINTLLKCMFIDNITNEIFFRFNILDKISNELYKIIVQENSKTCTNNMVNLRQNSSKNNLKNVKEKEKEKEKDRDKNKKKYKTNNLEITVLDCSLKKINIMPNKSESHYYKIPEKLLKSIFEVKNYKDLFNTNYNDISNVERCLAESSHQILNAVEENVINEEQLMIKKAKESLFNKISDRFQNDKFTPGPNNKFMSNTFNKTKPFKLGEESEDGKFYKDKNKKGSIFGTKPFEEKSGNKYKLKTMDSSDYSGFNSRKYNNTINNNANDLNMNKIKLGNNYKESLLKKASKNF